MSIASTSNRWLNRHYKTVATLLVLLAVLISSFRLFLPYVENYRVEFQNYLNDKNQTNGVIGSLSVAWQRTGPTIVMKNVRLFENDQASIHIKQLDLQVDFWESISQQQLISNNLVLTGAKINVNQGLWQEDLKASGNSISNEVNKTSLAGDRTTNDFELIANIFINRLNRFTIKDSQIVIKSETLTRDFHINKLTWLNEGDVHQAQGSVVLNGLSSNNLQLSLKLIGEEVSELNGQVYLKGNHLDITPWLDNLLAIDNDKTKTDISFATWLNVNNSSVDRLQVELAENKISWSFENEQQNLTLGQGQLLLVKGKQKESFKLFSTPLSLQFNQQPSQNLTLMLNKKASDYSAYISTVDFSLASQLVPLFVGEKTNRELLAKLSLTGQVNDLYIRNRPRQDNPTHKETNQSNMQVVANFSNVSSDYSHGIPGITNLSGNVSFDDNYLALEMLALQGALDFDKHFVQPFKYQSLSAQANISFNKSGWSLAVNELDFISEQIKLSAQVQLEAPVKSEMTMALLANIKEGNAGNVGHYLPLSIMSENLVNYLNNAFVSGTIKQAQVLLNGPLANFPFTDNSGIFVVDAELTDSQFKFADNWPAITDFSANLNFTKNSMLITGREGSLTGLDVTGVRAAINDFGSEILTVNALIKPTPAKAIEKLMSNSPLKNSVGSVLEQLDVNGNITGQFDLNLPLNDLDNVLASGKINFKDNQVILQTPRMNFSQVEGQLHFVNDVIETNNLSVVWQDLPLALNIKGIDKKEYYDTDIKLSANWPEKKWQQHVPSALQKYLQDQVSWQGSLSLHQHHQGGFSYDFTLNSDLLATTLNLPSPYGKNAQQKNKLVVNVNGQMQQSKITAQLDDNLNFFGVLNHQDIRFSRAHLVLGDEKMLLPMDGFHITTKLEQADFSLWQPLLSDIISSIAPVDADEGVLIPEQTTVNPQDVPLFAKPERIRGTIGKLAILGQELNNVSFNLLDKEHWWLLQLNAKETRSQLTFYPSWLEQGVDINAEFIHLNKKKDGLLRKEDSALTLTKSISDEQPSLSAVENIKQVNQSSLEQAVKEFINNNDTIFSSIPPLKLHCDRCQVGSLNFGQVDFTVERSGDDMVKINHFRAEREQAKLNFTATWFKNDLLSETSLSGDMSLNSIEYELKQLGFDSIIRDSGGNVDFNVSWQGGPHDFDLSNLNGKYEAKLDDGYLAEVSDKARIFSVLSLESLVRKLTLDFRDIFSDGMFYSDIRGDYIIEQGVLTTTNTKMNGTAGNLLMKGSTDLVSGELDYKLSYKPNLSSSLPVLAWIATLNPVTFLAGVAIDQVIKSQVVSEFNFELTGTVGSPQFKEVNRKNKNIRVNGSSVPEIVDSTTKPQKPGKDEKLPVKHLEQYNKKKVSLDLAEKEKIDG